jgi:hypothetical protein
VAADAALDLDRQLVRPLLERQAPRQAEERTLVGAGEQPEMVSGGNGADP